MKHLLPALFFTVQVLSAYTQTFYPIGGMQNGQTEIATNTNLGTNARLSHTLNKVLPRIRVAYVVPSNRAAQMDYKENLQFAIEMTQHWYKDNMQQNGFGAKTFQYETEETSPRPKIHLVNVSETEEYLRGNNGNDLFNRTSIAAQNAGLSVGADGEIWVIIPETLLQKPDATFTGGLALGTLGGNGLYGGVVQLSSLVIHLFNSQSILNNDNYGGQVISSWGPYPLINNVSFPWFEGTTFSSLASSYLGALCHEIGHAFGLRHDSRMDENAFGGVMFNGLRGIRGSIFPSLYPTEYTRLEFESSLQLNENQYFNKNKTVNSTPTIGILTSGNVSPINGLLNIRFTAADIDTVAYALLVNQSGDVIDELALNSPQSDTTFKTVYYSAGYNSFSIVVGDKQGNRTTSSSFTLAIAAGINQVPKPFLKILYPNIPYTGNSTLFNASLTSDPNNDSFLTEFDFNNDGIFDTTPSSNPTIFYDIPQIGPYMSRIRVTDSQGASFISIPISGNFRKECGVEPPSIYGEGKICTGSATTLTVNRCYGAIRWSNGETSKSINVIPSTTSNYTVNCQYGCSNQTSEAFIVELIPNDLSLTNLAQAGSQKATQTITSNQTIQSNRQMAYVAGNSITLTPNFNTEYGSTFQTILQSCNLPIAISDYTVAFIETPKTIVVLSNDFNPDGTAITDFTKIAFPTVVINPTKGSVSVNSDGSIRYTSYADITGTDTFVYSICKSGSSSECVTATVTITLSPTPKLIINGNFETLVSFTHAPWQKGGWKLNQGIFSWEYGTGRNYSNCIKMNSGSLAGVVQSNDIYAYQTLTLTPNTDYILKGWVKTENVTPIFNPNGKGACLSLIVSNNPWPPASIGLNGTNDWTQLSLNFNSGSTGIITIACRLGYTNADSDGTAYFDDLTVIPY